MFSLCLIGMGEASEVDALTLSSFILHMRMYQVKIWINSHLEVEIFVKLFIKGQTTSC